MKTYYVNFHGRHANAIGIFYGMGATIEAENDADFAAKFYSKYELSGRGPAMVANSGHGEYKPFDFTKAFQEPLTGEKSNG